MSKELPSYFTPDKEISLPEYFVPDEDTTLPSYFIPDRLSIDAITRAAPIATGNLPELFEMKRASERGFFGKIKEAWQRGNVSAELHRAYGRAALRGPEAQKRAEEAVDKFIEHNQLYPMESNWLSGMVYGGARIASPMVTAWVNAADEALLGAATGAGMAAIAGQAGPQLLTPEEVVTVPAAATAGLVIGAKIGATRYFQEIAVGQMLYSMKKKGVDDNIAIPLAMIASVPYALIEMTQASMLTPGLRKGAQKVTERSLGKILLAAGKKYGATLTHEALEEVAQEGVQIVTEDLGEYFSKHDIDINKAWIKERAGRVWETGTKSLYEMALLPVPGAVSDIHAEAETWAARKAVKQMDLGDMNEWAALAKREIDDTQAQRETEAAAPTEVKRAGAMRDPQTGRFVKQDAAPLGEQQPDGTVQAKEPEAAVYSHGELRNHVLRLGGVLGLFDSEKGRRAFNVAVTGKEHTADMTAGELETLAGELSTRLRERPSQPAANVAVTPTALDRAKRFGVDARRARGTGKGGTVTAQDVEFYVHTKLRAEAESKAGELAKQLGGEEIDRANLPPDVYIGEPGGRGVGHYLMNYLLGMRRIRHMLRAADGYEYGPHAKYILDPVHQAQVAHVFNETGLMERANDKLTSLGLNLRALSKRSIGPELTLRDGTTVVLAGRKGKPQGMRVGAALKVWMANQDPHLRERLWYGNRLSPEMIEAITDSLPGKVKEFGSYMLEEYAAIWEQIAPIYESQKGKPLGRVQFYSPGLGETDYGSFDAALDDDMLGRTPQAYVGVPAPYTKQRTGSKSPLRLDAMGEFLYYIRGTSHYANFAPLAHDLKALIGDPAFRRAFVGWGGDKRYKLLTKWLDDVTHTSVQESRATKEWADVLRHNTGTALLAFNVLSAMRQPLSLFTAIGESPLQGIHIMYAAMEQMIPVHAGKLRKAMDAESPALSKRLRHHERDLREMEARRMLDFKTARLRRLGFAFIRHMDRQTITAVYTGAKRYYMAQHGTEMVGKELEAAAIRHAEDVVLRTQPAADIHELAAFYRERGWARWFTMFQNQVNQNANVWANYLGEITSGKISPWRVDMHLWRVAWSFVVPAMLYGVISRGRLPRRWKEATMDLLSYPMASLAFVGQVAVSALRGFGGYAPPALIPAEEIGRGFAEAGEEPTKAVGAVLKALAMSKGLPVAQPTRTVRGIIDLSTGSTDYWRRLFWSEGAMDMPAEHREGRPRRPRRPSR